ncbi:MAG: GTP-binding protein [Chloroherpetonaceae bacterium]|nr:GTP-binding protein [Chloroherpetonaceae bacterium]
MAELIRHKIPVNLLTGFLGSGKTTLLKRLLRENAGRRKIAILMNEIGEVSIDAKLLEGFSIELYELNDGCICCTINENFVAAIDEITEKLSPDLLVIETTGVANPISIIYSLINPNLVLDAVLTTVDAKNFLRIRNEVNVWQDQLECADVVLLTKTDIASEVEISEVENAVRATNARCQIFRAADIALELIFGVAYPRNEAQLPPAILHHHLQADGIETFRFQDSALTFSLPLLQEALEQLPTHLWRLKGTIRLAEQPQSFILNYAFGQYTIEDYVGHAEGCDLVFIGKSILQSKEQFTASLRRAAASLTRAD